MLFASVGDVLIIRKHYQKTFKLDSDENSCDNTLTCLSTTKLLSLLSDYSEELLTGELLHQLLSESIIEVSMEEVNNYAMTISDPEAGGSTTVGYSGKDKYDSYNFFEPETVDDQREYPDNSVSVPKSAKKSGETQYNQTRTTSTGRKERLV